MSKRTRGDSARSANDGTQAEPKVFITAALMPPELKRFALQITLEAIEQFHLQHHRYNVDYSSRIPENEPYDLTARFEQFLSAASDSGQIENLTDAIISWHQSRTDRDVHSCAVISRGKCYVRIGQQEVETCAGDRLLVIDVNRIVNLDQLV
jgi:hypothetical protein